jgi:tetratricopeptide (TPR) repeat protein
VGLLCLLTENYHDAVTHLEYAVRIYTNTMGLKHQEVASTLMLKGLAQLALERFDDSMASMYRVRYSREHILGRQHPELGLILNNMACVQYELKDYKQAEALFQEALDLQREIFSSDPLFLKQVSIVLCNIAFLHAKSGSFPKALIELEGALQIRQDILHEDNDSLSDILQNMAHILAIHQLQHGAVNLDEMTEEYITMLKKSGSKR